ncbi:helix-turn-helix transcriptional regulator [Nesterenkonia suensis]
MYFHYQYAVVAASMNDLSEAQRQNSLAQSPVHPEAPIPSLALAAQANHQLISAITGDGEATMAVRGSAAVLHAADGLNLDQLRQLPGERPSSDSDSFLQPLDTLAELFGRLLRGLPPRPAGMRRLESPLEHDVTEQSQVILLLSAGQLDRAEELLESCSKSRPHTAANTARLALMRNQPHSALQELHPSAESLQLTPRQHADLQALRCAALITIDSRQPHEDALAALAEACVEARTVLPLALIPGNARRLVAQRLASHCLAQRMGRHRLGLPDDALERAASVHTVFEAQNSTTALSTREREVLARMADGLSLAEIAMEQYRSLSTIKKQAMSTYRKLDVRTREGAVTRAHQLGLLGSHLAAEQTTHV